MRDASMNEYKKRMADNPAEVPSYSDIKNAHDVSMYVADKLGGMSKYIASYFMGGLPASWAQAQSTPVSKKQPTQTPPARQF
jgi:hypothetical protein